MDAPSEEELAFAGSRSHSQLEIMRLKHQLASLKLENDALRRQACEAMSDSEKSQEQISNRLIRQIDQMRKERAELVNAVEAEEEFLTNVLQKRLEAMQRQKEQLEGSLESDREAIISRLQTQIDNLMLKAGASHSAALEQLKIEVANLKQKSFQRESELQSLVESLQADNQQLVQENMRLSQRLRRSSTDSLLSSSAGVNVPSPLTGPLAGVPSPPTAFNCASASPGNVHLKRGSIADLRQHSASSSNSSFQPITSSAGFASINSAASSDSELNFTKMGPK